MRNASLFLLSVAFLASVATQPVRADEWREHGGHEYGEHEGWHEHGDIVRFHEHDYDHWREGNWFHGFHEGRNGWWWIVSGLWYFYPTPIYPYPDPYTPPTVIVQPVPAAPVGVAPSYTYYCSNPAGYYPYVAQCYNTWQRVVPVASQPAPVAVPNVGLRERDDRELNELATEFEALDLNSRHARAALTSINKQVEAFRQELYKRDYNAMDILHDAESLQHRIQEKKENLSSYSRHN